MGRRGTCSAGTLCDDARQSGRGLHALQDLAEIRRFNLLAKRLGVRAVLCRFSAAMVVLISFVSPVLANGQTAEDYFHGGATNYVFGQKEKAKEQIVTGLQAFPADPKLNQLAALLKKEEEQKQQQKNQQQQQQQKKDDQKKDQKQNQDQKKDSDQKKDQNQSNESKKDQEKKQQDQAKKDADQKKEQEKKDQQTADQKKQEKRDKSDQNDQHEPQPTYAAGQMTPQQAKQLLDAQKGDEMIIPIHPQVKPRDPNKPLKDW
jgi:Ca-activated chloride channel family protein